jgi:AcrR family transcriptional regulator
MTVASVTTHAMVSRKTFYLFFEDREACFLAMLDEIYERALAGVQALEPAGDWPQQLRTMLEHGLCALACYPLHARVACVEVLAAGPAALQRRADALAELARLLARGYEVAPPDHEIPELMPEAIAGALDEIVRAHICEGRADELPALLPDLMYCALAPFVGPERAKELAAEAAA